MRGEVAADISELDHETREFEDALSEITSEADTGIGTLITEGKRKKSLPGVKKARDYVEKEATARELLKREVDESLATYQYALRASRDKTADNLKAYLADPVHANNLKRFVEPSSPTGRQRPAAAAPSRCLNERRHTHLGARTADRPGRS